MGSKVRLEAPMTAISAYIAPALLGLARYGFELTTAVLRGKKRHTSPDHTQPSGRYYRQDYPCRESQVVGQDPVKQWR